MSYFLSILPTHRSTGAFSQPARRTAGKFYHPPQKPNIVVSPSSIALLFQSRRHPPTKKRHHGREKDPTRAVARHTYASTTFGRGGHRNGRYISVRELRSLYFVLVYCFSRLSVNGSSHRSLVHGREGVRCLHQEDCAQCPPLLGPATSQRPQPRSTRSAGRPSAGVGTATHFPFAYNQHYTHARASAHTPNTRPPALRVSSCPLPPSTPNHAQALLTTKTKNIKTKTRSLPARLLHDERKNTGCCFPRAA